MGSKLLRTDLVYAEVRRYTQQVLCELENSQTIPGVDTTTVADNLQIDRANVSKALNFLWRAGKLVKIQGRPTLYLSHSDLVNRFPERYIPVFIPIGEKITSILQTDTISTDDPAEDIHRSSLDSMIGTQGSMRKQIELAKAAVSYPPNGLHTYICGGIGVGKLSFAQKTFAYGKQINRIPKTGKFILINCQDYSGDTQISEDLVGSTRGGKVNIGLLEKCNKGALYFDGAEKLSSQNVDAIIHIMRNGYYSRKGSTSRMPINCMFFFSSMFSPNDNAVIGLSKYIPIKIHIPDIDNRGSQEKIELLVSSFASESQKIGITIRMPINNFLLLCAAKYEHNMGELNSVVKTCVSRAHHSNRSKQNHIIDVQMEHFPDKLLELTYARVDISPHLEALNEYSNEYVYFYKNGLSSLQSLLSHNQPANSCGFLSAEDFISKDVTIITKKVFHTLIHDSRLGFEAYKQSCNHQLTRKLHSILKSSSKYSFISDNEYYFYTLFEMVSSILRLSDVLSPEDINTSSRRADEHFQVINQFFELSTSKTSPEISELLHSVCNDALNLLIENRKQGYLGLLIIKDPREPDDAYKRILSQCSYNIQYKLLTLREDQSIKSFNEIIQEKISNLDSGKGVLIMTNLPQFNQIQSTSGIPVHTVYPSSFPMLDYVLSNIGKHHDIDYFRKADIYSHPYLSSYSNEETFLQQMTKTVLANELKFLDPEKISHTLYTSLVNILKDLDAKISKEIMVKFIMHSAFMVERCIRKEPLDHKNVRKFYANYPDIISVIDKNVVSLNDLYGIKLPPAEIVYLAEMFIDYMS